MMRCMACGGEMILAAVKPDDAGMVAGFKHETLHCLVCRDTEHRFVYSPESSEKPELPPISPLPQHPVISSTSVEAISSSSPYSSRPQGTSWGRAVEKLRSRQTDIQMRAGGGNEKTDWNARFNQARERLGPPVHSSADRDTTHRRPKHLVRKSARALRIELWGPSPAGNRTNPSTIDEPSAASIEGFNRLWDRLLPARHRSDPLPEGSTTSVGPLPRSLSLVQVENLEGVSVAGRAILLLRGWEASG
jgi:hypothetical protein